MEILRWYGIVQGNLILRGVTVNGWPWPTSSHILNVGLEMIIIW